MKIDGQWGNTSISTFDFGYFSTNILPIRERVPGDATGTSIRTSSWVGHGTGPTVREAIFSTAACDFSTTYALKTSLGIAARSQAGNIAFTFKYTFRPATLSAVRLQARQVYYINVRNRCSVGNNTGFLESCILRGGLPRRAQGVSPCTLRPSRRTL